MKRTTIQVGTYGVNCSILEIDGRGWIIDPGSEADRIISKLEENHLAPAGILLTHAHFDHIGGIPDLQAKFPDLPVYVHTRDIPAFAHPMNQCPPDYPPIGKPRNVRDCATLPAILAHCDAPITVIPTPGHTPGGVCYFFPSHTTNSPSPILFSGDTLFAGSIGRTDLPGGDMATLVHSLEGLKSLPPETLVIPGHGMYTTIADELAGNPFLQ